MRGFLASEWLAAGVGVALTISHCWWLLHSEHQAEVITGFGGALTVLGVYVAGQPYIRKGLIETAREEVGLRHPAEPRQKEDMRHEEMETEGVRHVLQERVVGVILIALGSLLNGYGPAIARLFGMRGA